MASSVDLKSLVPVHRVTAPVLPALLFACVSWNCGHGPTIPSNSVSTPPLGPAITVSAPTAIGPLTGAQTSGKPTLSVTNAVRTGSASPLFYRFDVADNADFNPIMLTATVSEGGGRTAFTPAVELEANKTYYWHATAIDPLHAISSEPSITQRFTTSVAITLRDGTFVYTLTLSPAESCVVGYGGELGGPYAVLHPAELALEAPLKVTGNHLQFSLPQEWPYHGARVAGQIGLDLDIVRAGDRISGTLGGGFSRLRGTNFWVGVWRTKATAASNVPVVFSGTVSSRGVLTADFQGYVELMSSDFGDRVLCDAPEFIWTLAPTTN